MAANEESLEIEVKLQTESTEDALERLSRLPATLEEAPRFEDNEIFDTSDGRFASTHSLLRLRVVDGRGTITFKEKVKSDIQAKVRSEVETEVTSPDAIRTIFEKMGLARTWRYQKYRSYHSWTDHQTGDKLKICLDDTPIGVFVELEGPKETIDRATAGMGYGQGDQIIDDYRTLHLKWLEEHKLPQGDLVFGDRAMNGRPGE